MNLQIFGLGKSKSNAKVIGEIRPAYDVDSRYAHYGIVVRSNPALEKIVLDPPANSFTNAFLTSVNELRASLDVAKMADNEATGRFFRVGKTAKDKTLFICDCGDGFRVLDMESGSRRELSEKDMWTVLKDAHPRGGLHALMPGRMPI